MRIAYVLGHFPTLSETFIGNEMRAIEALGHVIVPIALHDPKTEFNAADAEFAARTLYFSSIPAEEAHRLKRRYSLRTYRVRSFICQQTTENPDHLLIHAAQMADHIRAQRCTHVHAHFGWAAATYAIAAAKLLGLPVSFTCHGSDVYVRPQDLVLKCRMANAVIGVAPTIGRDVQALAPSTKVHIIACGVDTHRFVPATEPALRHDRWLFVGRLIDCKGVADMLAAWSLIPANIRPRLDIIGSGIEESTLKHYTAEHGLESAIQFLGPKSSDWLTEHGPNYCAMIAPFRQGSDGARDTSPLVLKEAMAMGLPIVTTEFIDIAALVGECGLLCPVRDPVALAAAVQQVQAMAPEQRNSMGERGRQRVLRDYTLQQQANALMTVFGKKGPR